MVLDQYYGAVPLRARFASICFGLHHAVVCGLRFRTEARAASERVRVCPLLLDGRTVTGPEGGGRSVGYVIQRRASSGSVPPLDVGGTQNLVHTLYVCWAVARGASRPRDPLHTLAVHLA